MGGILDLADICKQSSALFKIAGERSELESFQRFATAVREKLNRFDFELQSEVQRIGNCDFGAEPSSRAGTRNTDLPVRRCELSLQRALIEYGRALTFRLPPHARAMLRRQQAEIQAAYERLVRLRKAA